MGLGLLGRVGVSQTEVGLGTGWEGFVGMEREWVLGVRVGLEEGEGEVGRPEGRVKMKVRWEGAGRLFHFIFALPMLPFRLESKMVMGLDSRQTSVQLGVPLPSFFPFFFS